MPRSLTCAYAFTCVYALSPRIQAGPHQLECPPRTTHRSLSLTLTLKATTRPGAPGPAPAGPSRRCRSHLSGNWEKREGAASTRRSSPAADTRSTTTPRSQLVPCSARPTGAGGARGSHSCALAGAHWQAGWPLAQHACIQACQACLLSRRRVGKASCSGGSGGGPSCSSAPHLKLALREELGGGEAPVLVQLVGGGGHHPVADGHARQHLPHGQRHSGRAGGRAHDLAACCSSLLVQAEEHKI